MKKINKGKITKIEEVANGTVFMSFEAEQPVDIKPGQFVSVLCDGLTLRRPFSVASFEGNEVGLLFKKKGKGTKYLSSLIIGDKVDFIGPLGNGFELKNGKALLIGAGIGVAPVFYLKNVLKQKPQESVLVGAFMSETDVPKGVELDEAVTNDGTQGRKGTVLDHLEAMIAEYKPQIIYSCGPEVVLKGVSEIAKKHGLEAQIAMEKVMACGIGVCKGCVIKVKKANEVQNLTICHDGPVFQGDEVVWE